MSPFFKWYVIDKGISGARANVGLNQHFFACIDRTGEEVKYSLSFVHSAFGLRSPIICNQTAETADEAKEAIRAAAEQYLTENKVIC